MQPGRAYSAPGRGPGAGLDSAFRDALRGRLPAVPPGGMTLAYVDDVAAGHLAAFDRGRPGERYILADGYAPMRELVAAVVEAGGRGRVPPAMPAPLARRFAAAGEARLRASSAARRCSPGELSFLLWEARADSARGASGARGRVHAVARGRARARSSGSNAGNRVRGLDSRYEVLNDAAGLAQGFVETLAERRVGPRADLDELRDRLAVPLGDAGEDPRAVIEDLARDVEPGLIASAGPRYFGFVIGGALPVAVAADWLDLRLGSKRRRLRRRAGALGRRGGRRGLDR